MRQLSNHVLRVTLPSGNLGHGDLPMREVPDVPPPPGFKPLREYRNTNPVGFHNWMKDRALVEQVTSQIELYVGAPQDLNPAGVQGPLLLRSK